MANSLNYGGYVTVPLDDDMLVIVDQIVGSLSKKDGISVLLAELGFNYGIKIEPTRNGYRAVVYNTTDVRSDGKAYYISCDGAVSLDAVAGALVKLRTWRAAGHPFEESQTGRRLR